MFFNSQFCDREIGTFWWQWRNHKAVDAGGAKLLTGRWRWSCYVDGAVLKMLLLRKLSCSFFSLSGKTHHSWWGQDIGITWGHKYFMWSSFISIVVKEIVRVRCPLKLSQWSYNYFHTDIDYSPIVFLLGYIKVFSLH